MELDSLFPPEALGALTPEQRAKLESDWRETNRKIEEQERQERQREEARNQAWAARMQKTLADTKKAIDQLPDDSSSDSD